MTETKTTINYRIKCPKCKWQISNQDKSKVLEASVNHYLSRKHATPILETKIETTIINKKGKTQKVRIQYKKYQENKVIQ